MEIYVVNPLADGRWDDLVARHPRATAFHERGWLEALTRTYGYTPYVLTSSRPEEPLKDGIILFRVSSWLTGTRLVSVPFADHCDPLLNHPNDLQDFARWLRAEGDRGKRRYVELRPLLAIGNCDHRFEVSCSYWFHELDLSPTLDELFRRMHKNSFRRKIRRAEREGVSYEVGSSPKLVNELYRLLLVTRKRHRLLPQPKDWLKNLVASMDGKIEIRVARRNGTAIGAMLTLRHRSCVIYKYGCSEASFHSLGVMPFLFWRLIEESKASGMQKIDFGRSELDNEGLIAFKDRIGAARRPLKYYRYAKTCAGPGIASEAQMFRPLFSILPDSLLAVAGSVVYKHMG